jgi:hypothetical protein
MSENFNFNNSNETTANSSIPSFSSFKNKDGSDPTQQNKNFNNKKKNRIDEIIDKPITITAVNYRKSNYDDNKEYLVLEYTDENGEECYTSTGSSGIRSAIENKGENLTFPCRATVVQRTSKSHPGWKYLTLN